MMKQLIPWLPIPCHHHLCIYKLQKKKKKDNNLVEDKYLQRLSHFKYFPIESTVRIIYYTPYRNITKHRIF